MRDRVVVVPLDPSRGLAVLGHRVLRGVGAQTEDRMRTSVAARVLKNDLGVIVAIARPEDLFTVGRKTGLSVKARALREAGHFQRVEIMQINFIGFAILQRQFRFGSRRLQKRRILFEFIGGA